MPTFTLKTIVDGAPVSESFPNEVDISTAVKTRWPAAKVSVAPKSLAADKTLGLAMTGEVQSAFVEIEPAITLNPALWPLA